MAQTYDIIVAGSGPIGLATALAARRTLGVRARILVCDPALSAGARSILAYAISAGPRFLLERLGVWELLRERQPIMRMDITDSMPADVMRQRFLHFDADGERRHSLAEMVEHDVLIDALLARARQSDILFEPDAIAQIERRNASIRVTMKSGRTFSSALLAACDGARSMIREFARIPVTGWNYQRSAIIATVMSELDHLGVAVQHFLPAGTFAMLPLAGRRYSIVWVEEPKEAERLCAAPREQFIAALQMRASREFGPISLLAGPQTLPLRLQIAQQFHAERIVLLGDAAHTTHPLAGQGLNLGLRDVAYLMDNIVPAARLGLDIGGFECLERYGQSRHFETVSILGAADALFRLFSTSAAPVRLMRDVGLGIVDRLPKLKSLFADYASGSSPGSPALLLPTAEPRLPQPHSEIFRASSTSMIGTPSRMG